MIGKNTSLQKMKMVGKKSFSFNSVPHNVMAEAVQRLKNTLHGSFNRVDRMVVSAGFVCDGKCFGKSESLRISSRPEKDTELLKDILKHE